MGQSGGAGSDARGDARFSKGVWLDARGEVIGSVYDDVREGRDPRRPLEERLSLPEAMNAGDRGRRGWYEDDLVSCFVPRDPAAVVHLLVVPREHVRNVAALDGPRHLELLQHMREVGQTQLRLCCERVEGSRMDKASFVFHVPPWNSIDHLHMHCFLRPYDNCWKWLKYRPGTPWCRSADDVIGRLRASNDRGPGPLPSKL
eukprot:gnl/TRDRNA2_/TRDRNA2_175751_c4_seq3.p1 gnl/TRDRNA2_/TRDRNA2_175751_c4~~gnl/TRDRNA2_/TRDRNA2_175751_c4_seq3.p1  ORF type:complete len:202 (-),score=28.29 gnl/TRDRNA2_/TRDRNA2_175751_c4_seq3:85-690(-)